MSRDAEANFVRQQGFACAAGEQTGPQFAALMFQPKVVAVFVVIGLILQAWPIFLALSVISWWNVLVPNLNPFDLLYNRLLARPKGLPLLTPAPPARRFAQGMAGTFMLAVAASLLLHWVVAAVVFEVMVVAALSALLFGKLCLGSYLFHLIRGRSGFANDTLPWAHA
jgi:hypothetical protein